MKRLGSGVIAMGKIGPRRSGGGISASSEAKNGGAEPLAGRGGETL